MMKKIAIIMVTVISVVSLAACASSDNSGGHDSEGNGFNIPFDTQEDMLPEDDGISSTDNTAGDYVLPEDGLAEGEIGDIMRTQQFDFTVNEVSAYGEEYADYTADFGFRLLAVNITVTNTFSEPVYLFDSDFLMVWDDSDDYDYTYPVDAAEISSNDFLPGEYSVNSGDEISGHLLFEVPAEIADFGLSYTEYDEEDNIYTVYFRVDPYTDGNADGSNELIYGKTGDTMGTSWFNFKVMQAALYSEYADSIPFDGYQYLVLNMKLENNYTEAVTVYDSDFYVEWNDPDSYEFPVIVIVNGEELMEGSYDLPLAGSTDVVMVYEVPEGFNEFIVYYVEYLEDGDEGGVFAVNLVPKQG